MRLHPIFTTLKDWTGDNKPDGVEAFVELQDQFGDPTKASGKIIFALYDFKKFDPERRGPLLAEWIRRSLHAGSAAGSVESHEPDVWI